MAHLYGSMRPNIDYTNWAAIHKFHGFLPTTGGLRTTLSTQSIFSLLLCWSNAQLSTVRCMHEVY